MKKFIFILTIALASIGILSTVSSVDASATSIYDDIIVTSTFPLEIKSSNNNHTFLIESKSHLIDVLSNDINLNNSNGYCTRPSDLVYSDFVFNLIESYPYLISQETPANFALIQVSRINNSSSYTYNWNTSGLTVQAPSSDFNSFILRLKNDGSLVVCNDGISSYININSANNFLYYESNIPIEYPSGYEGDVISDSPSSTLDVYPKLSFNLKDAVDGLSRLSAYPNSETWEARNIPPPRASLLTLEGPEGIIVPDNNLGFNDGAIWNELPNGVYTLYLDLIYTDEDVLERFNFLTTEFRFEVTGEGYSVIYHPEEDKYCSVKNGFEWNCNISQPSDPIKETITGDGEEWSDYECSWTQLEGCVRNMIHWFGKYIGINPSPSGFAESLTQKQTDMRGLTSVLIAPMSVFVQIQNAQLTCTQVALPLPYIDDDIYLPCLYQMYQNRFGDLFQIYQVVISAIVGYYVSLHILRMVKNFKEPESKNIEATQL